MHPGRAPSPGWWRSLATVASTVLRSSAARRVTPRLKKRRKFPIRRPDAVAVMENAEQQRRLQDCLGQLEERQAAAIRSAFLDGATYEELAMRAAIPLSTMKSMIRRSLMKLRACLET